MPDSPIDPRELSVTEPSDTGRSVVFGRSQESTLFQASVDALRALGCRCPLRYDGSARTAVPHTPGDAQICPYHQRQCDDGEE